MRFMEAWREELDSEPLLDQWQDTVTRLTLEEGRVRGVETSWVCTSLLMPSS